MFLTNSQGGQIKAEGKSAEILLSLGWIEVKEAEVQEASAPKAPARKATTRAKTAPKTN
jgi:hypothetical protein